MTSLRRFTLPLATVLGSAVLLGLSTGCESTGGGSLSGSSYYGVGFYDPWYYGGYYNHPDIIVAPPDRPDRPNSRPHPEQPIARPPGGGARPTPMPSIPSGPRPSFRR